MRIWLQRFDWEVLGYGDLRGQRRFGYVKGRKSIEEMEDYLILPSNQTPITGDRENLQKVSKA